MQERATLGAEEDSVVTEGGRLKVTVEARTSLGFLDMVVSRSGAAAVDGEVNPELEM